jgi:disulfide bond formation protein DsbB
MTLDQYSLIVSLGSIAIFCGTLIVFLASMLSPKLKDYLLQKEYEEYVFIVLIISGMSVAGSLIYQLIYNTPVCELCWWQRIFLYPIAIMSLVTYLTNKSKDWHISTLILSLFGLFYASYHYYYHYMGFVLGRKLELPCSVGGLMPACTDSPILIFGFITIPFMGIMVFGSILLITLLIIKNKYEHK